MKMPAEPANWSKFYAFRKEIRRIYPSVYDLQIKRKLLEVVAEELGKNDLVLEIGASDRGFFKKLKRSFPMITYKTMDIDTSLPHDYYTLDDITETFDIIILAEVIEHLEFSEALLFLKRLNGLLNNNGKIIITTPNIHHPNRYWQDPDHKTPFSYEAIGGALLSTGYKIDRICRIYNDQFFRKLLRVYISSYLHRHLNIDFANSIVAVARKS
jgi:hypothetical protein